jgi:hypothetical protein
MLVSSATTNGRGQGNHSLFGGPFLADLASSTPNERHHGADDGQGKTANSPKHVAKKRPSKISMAPSMRLVLRPWRQSNTAPHPPAPVNTWACRRRRARSGFMSPRFSESCRSLTRLIGPVGLDEGRGVAIVALVTVRGFLQNPASSSVLPTSSRRKRVSVGALKAGD